MNGYEIGNFLLENIFYSIVFKIIDESEIVII